MSASQAEQVLIDAKNLQKLFPLRRSVFSRGDLNVHAVDGVDFMVRRREIFGLVGESGCGKTTTSRLLAKLLVPTRGRIFVDGWDMSSLRGKAEKQFRKKVQMIFQDPYESLNPRFTVFATVAEPLFIQGADSVEDRVSEALQVVGLSPVSDFLFRYPHELSGGQRQRVAIARALAISPQFLVADEPVSMLDASLRAGIMNLLMDLREQLGLTYIMVTHDLAVARYMTDRMAVMYLGKIVELGPTESLIKEPRHPYTKALLASVPAGDPFTCRTRSEIKGVVPTPVNPKPGCRFLERCSRAMPRCREEHPPMVEIAVHHDVACYLYDGPPRKEVG